MRKWIVPGIVVALIIAAAYVGIRRDVFLDQDGRQYVKDGKNLVYDVWIYIDEPEFTSDVHRT